MRTRVLSILLIAALVVGTVSALAQDAMAVTPETVTVTADDGLTLTGDWYALPAMGHEGQHPTLLLMHMLGANRSTYAPLIPALLDGGYNVLNVDLRGHGDSPGVRDWAKATGDVQTWLDWLRDQPAVNPDAVAIIGASIGSNLALIGCANDSRCVTAVALSPGLDYQGLMPEDALTGGLQGRSALLLASHEDAYSADSVRQMFANARGDIAAHLYPGRAHGTNLFAEHLDGISGLILAWLGEHMP